MSIGTAVDTEPIPGYRLIERLGAGGYGEVWKAEAPGGLTKAMKFVYGALAETLASQELLAFDRIRAVRHPFILSLERVEVASGRLIIVSELADKTLWARFEECRAAGSDGIARAELLRYLQDAAEALDYMTEQFQLQHLDIKPSNLFLVGGRLKVGDFGLVRDVYHDTFKSGGLSPAYAAPESFTGEVSRYTDQYALAIVYQEMLTGVRPFRIRSGTRAADRSLQDHPNLAPLTPADRLVVARALSWNPRDRFPTCTEMVRALGTISEQEPPNTPRDDHGKPSSDLSFARPLPTGPGDTIALMVGERTCASAATSATCPASMPFSPAMRMVRNSILAAARDESAPEPTLFIGIGGLAARVLGHTKQLFQAGFGACATRPLVGWLLLDTDRNTLSAVRADGARALAPEETLLMPLHAPEHYRGRLGDLLGWLGRTWVYRIPRSHSTEGLRPLGRLALIDNAERVLPQLRHAVTQITSRMDDDSKKRDFKVFVISSIAGGTGGGCLADVGFAVRRILREERQEDTPVEAVLILGASVQREQQELAQASAYATLTELNHFLDPVAAFPGEKALGLVAVEHGLRLFDSVRLIDFGDISTERDIDSGAHLAGEYLRLMRGTPYGRKLESARPRTAAPPGTPAVRSFRLARFGFPRTELRRVVASEVCKRVLAHWQSATPEAAEGVEAEADRFYAQLELSEEKVFEVVCERAERVLGADPRNLGRRAADDVRTARNRRDLDPIIRRFFDQTDRIIARRTTSEDVAATDLEVKLHHEFKPDSTCRHDQLDTWLNGIAENPARGLRAAGDAQVVIARRLTAAAEATDARLTAIRSQKLAIRNRFPDAASQGLVPNLLRNLWADTNLQAAEKLHDYGALCESEIALLVRAEILSSLQARAAQWAREFERIGEGLSGIARRFRQEAVRARTSVHPTIGSSMEILPAGADAGPGVAESLAASFCSLRWLGAFGRQFQEEILEPHGGLAAIMARDPRHVGEWFQSTLLERVAVAVDLWLGDMDAASLLMRRHGSAEEVENELRKCLKSSVFRTPGAGGRRLVVCTPGSPSGRSLRERLAASNSIEVDEFVTIPEDVAICLEIENTGLASIAAGLTSGQSLVVDLAGKLMTREDVTWTALAPSD
jgi:hypothetical protein